MKYILPIIVISQFFCTSLWFAGNAISTDITREFHFDRYFLANLTSVIQVGFIAGTLAFAVLSIADRFSPSRIFFISSILAGIFNLGITIGDIHVTEILLFRFLTGFFLAGIYPVGMKIVSDHFRTGLGKSLGFLVGALVLGTSFPHLLKELSAGFPWRAVLYATTFLSVSGGLSVLLFVPDGPYRMAGQKPILSSFLEGFSNREFRSVSYGYFGHMWELYTFWAFVPLMLEAHNLRYPASGLNIPLFSFLIIGSGSIACVFSGIFSQRFGAKKLATLFLLLSCLCCLTSPLFLYSGSVIVFVLFLFLWGVVVIADSPLFSTLVAENAPVKYRGSSLTIINCIGFSITIISLQCMRFFTDKMDTRYIYLFLAIGPILGLLALLNSNKKYAGNNRRNR